MNIVAYAALLFSIAASLMAIEPYRAAEADWSKVVDGVTLKKGVLGFGAVRLGMTHAQAEQALGMALPVHKEEQVPVCGEWMVGPLPADGYEMQLQFSGLGVDSVVQSIDIRPAPGDRATDRASVMKRIKKRFPGLVFVTSVHEPELTEAESWCLTYSPKENPRQGVYFNLSWGSMAVTLIECLD